VSLGNAGVVVVILLSVLPINCVT